MVKKSNKRRMNEWHESGRSFPEGVKFYVNGKKLPIKDDFWLDDIADVFVSECKRTRGLEDWIRDYMNSLGDSDFDNGGMMPIDEICYWFAKELQYDFDDYGDGEFYVDGSGITHGNHGVRVEIFDDEEVTESTHRTRRTAKRPMVESKRDDIEYYVGILNDMYGIDESSPEFLSLDSAYGKIRLVYEKRSTGSVHAITGYMQASALYEAVLGMVELKRLLG